MYRCGFTGEGSNNIIPTPGFDRKYSGPALIGRASGMPVCEIKQGQGKRGPAALCTQGGNPTDCPELFGK